MRNATLVFALRIVELSLEDHLSATPLLRMRSPFPIDEEVRDCRQQEGPEPTSCGIGSQNGTTLVESLQEVLHDILRFFVGISLLAHEEVERLPVDRKQRVERPLVMGTTDQAPGCEIERVRTPSQKFSRLIHGSWHVALLDRLPVRGRVTPGDSLTTYLHQGFEADSQNRQIHPDLRISRLRLR